MSKGVRRSVVDILSLIWTKVRHSLGVGYDDKVVMCPKESEARGSMSYL